MLKGIDPLLGPELLAVLRGMGHGDEIVIADANFPAATANNRVIRADGIAAPRMVAAIVSVLPLDDFVPAAAFRMAVVDKPDEVPAITADFAAALASGMAITAHRGDRTFHLLRPRQGRLRHRRHRRDAALRQSDFEEGRHPPGLGVMRIDAHQHFWRLDRGDYGWLTIADHPKIARDFSPGDLAPLLAAGRIDRTILVQAAPTDAETAFLLQIWPTVRPSSPASSAGWISRRRTRRPASRGFAPIPKRLVGLRPMVQDIADDEWLLRPDLARAFEAMQRGDLCFDALVKPRHLPALAEFLDRYPDLPVVIDHAAKPDIAHSGLDMWATYIRHIAKSTNAHCKLSGLASEAGPGWSAATLKLYVDVLLESFGPERLMWGSDWPVLNEAGDYAAWLTACETLTKHLPATAREAIFGGTAATTAHDWQGG